MAEDILYGFNGWNVHPDDFLNDFELVAEIKGWSPDIKKIAIGAYLTGAVKCWFRYIFNTLPGKTFEELATELKYEFMPVWEHGQRHGRCSRAQPERERFRMLISLYQIESRSNINSLTKSRASQQSNNPPCPAELERETIVTQKIEKPLKDEIPQEPIQTQSIDNVPQLVPEDNITQNTSQDDFQQPGQSNPIIFSTSDSFTKTKPEQETTMFGSSDIAQENKIVCEDDNHEMVVEYEDVVKTDASLQEKDDVSLRIDDMMIENRQEITNNSLQLEMDDDISCIYVSDDVEVEMVNEDDSKKDDNMSDVSPRGNIPLQPQPQGLIVETGNGASVLQLPATTLEQIRHIAADPGASTLRLPPPATDPPAGAKELDFDLCYVCKHCKVAFPSPAPLQAHQARSCYAGREAARGVIRVVQPALECRACPGERFRTVAEFRRHADTEAHLRSAAPPLPPPVPAEPLTHEMEDVVNQITLLAARAAQAQDTASPKDPTATFCAPGPRFPPPGELPLASAGH